MNRSAPYPKKPVAEPAVPLPLDFDEDPGDESIYSLSYRARVGVVVRDGTATRARLIADEPAAEPAGGDRASGMPPARR